MYAPFWFQFIIAVLATYRISRMVAWELGPWSLFERLRTRIWKYAQGRRDSWLYQGITCPLCVGWWVAGLIALAAVLSGWLVWYEGLLVWQGIAGGAVVLQQQERGK